MSLDLENTKLQPRLKSNLNHLTRSQNKEVSNQLAKLSHQANLPSHQELVDQTTEIRSDMQHTHKQIKNIKFNLDRLFISKKNRYVELHLDDAFKKVTIHPGYISCLQIPLHGCDSPVMFSSKFDVTDKQKRPDLSVYLSTDHREPNAINC